jgi:hypothetical protein
MTKFAITLALFSALALTAGVASGQSVPAPTDAQITASADPNPITYGRSTTIVGRLKSTPVKAGVLVRLQELPAPYDGGWQEAGTATTRTNGSYRFAGVSPDRNTRFRTVTTVPQSLSRDISVPVRIKVVLRLSDRTPAKGQKVTFSGTAAPEHDGRLVHIQRRSSSGKWRTLRRTALRDAGTELSSFTRNIRVRRDGTFRAVVFHDRDHADGFSRPKSAFIH